MTADQLKCSTMCENRTQKIKDIAQIAQSIVTILALIVGGIWTYNVFIVQREDVPQLNIKHTVTLRGLLKTIHGFIFPFGIGMRVER